MLPLRHLLIPDPSLPEDVRHALAASPEEGAHALLELGLSCHDAVELAGLEAGWCKAER
jgi:hypothetical protein